jgi:hypothetical protein
MKYDNDHITPLLSELHWLPIDARNQHKIAVLTFKAVSTKSQATLLNWCLFISRPGNSDRLQVLNVETVFGSPAFCHAAPAVWNSLPTETTDTSLSLETFKSRLNSHLFDQSFRC